MAKKFIAIVSIAFFIVMAISISGRYDISTLGFDVASNGKDLSIKTAENISEVYDVTITKNERVLLQVGTDDRDNYSDSNGYIIHGVADLLQKHKVYEIMVSTNGRFARFGTFCFTEHEVLNKARGWFSEDLQIFSRRCSS